MARTNRVRTGAVVVVSAVAAWVVARVVAAAFRALSAVARRVVRTVGRDAWNRLEADVGP